MNRILQLLNALRGLVSSVASLVKPAASVDAEASRAGTAAGAAAYEAGKRAQSSDWYYVDGVRYCSICRTRRCVRQTGGMLPCKPVSEGVS